MSAPSDETAPIPVIVPEPPKPVPVILRGSAPTLKPLRSRTAPEATVVPLVVSLRAAALPSLRTPRLTARVVKLLPEPESVKVLVPVLVRAKAPVTFPLSVRSPKPPIEEALPKVMAPESVAAVGLLFQRAALKLPARAATPVPLIVSALLRLSPLTSSIPAVAPTRSVIVPLAVAA